MESYNKIMLKFWLIVAIGLTLFITYMGITDGIKKWGFYYVFAVLAFLVYLIRKFMMKRLERYHEDLKNKN